MTRRRLGRLRHRVTFVPPESEEDGYGNTTDGFDEDAAFSVWGDIAFRSASEAVEAGQRTGAITYKIRIRANATTRAITTDWLARAADLSASLELLKVDTLSDRRWVWIDAEALTGVVQ